MKKEYIIIAKGNPHYQQRQTQTEVEDTSFEVDNSLIGKWKFSSGSSIVIYLIIGLAFFIVYSKYWHKPFVKKIRRRKK